MHFRRWHKKTLILLTTLNLAYVISTPKPEELDDETLEQAKKRRSGIMMTSYVGDIF